MLHDCEQIILGFTKKVKDEPMRIKIIIIKCVDDDNNDDDDAFL